jgi:hypothetical protein
MNLKLFICTLTCTLTTPLWGMHNSHQTAIAPQDAPVHLFAEAEPQRTIPGQTADPDQEPEGTEQDIMDEQTDRPL